MISHCSIAVCATTQERTLMKLKTACASRRWLSKIFVLCTYFFAIISSFSISAVILNRSSFHLVLVISTGSFTVLSSVILRSSFVVSIVRLYYFVISCFFVLCFVQVVSSIRTLSFASHVHCSLLLYCQ